MVLKHNPTLPNYSFLQLEEINQVIYNYTKYGFTRTSQISTDVIKEEFPSTMDGRGVIGIGFDNIRYNFTLITMRKSGKIYTWTFKVVNTLWTGGWQLLNLDGTQYTGEYTSLTTNKGGDTLILEGENLHSFILNLTMSNDTLGRQIATNTYQFVGNYEYSHQFSSNITEYATLQETKTKKLYSNATVKFVPLTSTGKVVTSTDGSYLKPYTAINKGNGKYGITYSATKSGGTYYGRLEAYIGGIIVAQQTVKVTKIQKYEPVVIPKVKEPEKQLDYDLNTLWINKGAKRTFKMKLHAENIYGHSIKPNEKIVVNIYHTYDVAHNDPFVSPKIQKMKTEVHSVLADNDGTFEFKLSARDCYVDKSYFVISLAKSASFNGWTSERIPLNHYVKTAVNYADLKTECEKEDGADLIVLENKDYTASNDHKEIKINRTSTDKQYIVGRKGSGWSTINENGYGILFNVGESKKLYMRGVKVINSDCAIFQNEKSFVELVSCAFVGNKFVRTKYIGGVVYQDKISSLQVNSCFFENNYGNCIKGLGYVIIENSLFKVTDDKYVVQPEPFVLEQYEGEAVLKNNQIYVNTSLTWDSKGKPKVVMANKNRSYAKISIWCGKTATINGKSRNQMNTHNTLNFFDAPYNNKAYIFSAYWYPHGINAFIVASSTNKNINRATGHAVQGTNFAWRDGYYLVRESSKDYNTYNPFVKFVNGQKIVSHEITVPSSGGVW